MSKKENFALNVSALSTYTDQTTGLAKEIILGATTIKNGLVSIQYGAVGDKVALNVLKNTMYGVNGTCGSFTDTGSTIMAQSLVQMTPIKFSQGICLETLNKYYYSFYMEKSYTNQEGLGEFEDVFVSGKLDATALEVDKILWLGASSAVKYAATTGNLTLADGFLQVAYANSASTVNVAKTAITASNGYQIVDAIVASIAANAPVLLEEANLYLSPADFQNYLASLRGLNLFNYNTMSQGVTEIHHPGSIGMKVVRVNGMIGAASGTALATKKDNIWAVISDEADLDFAMWYSRDFNELRMEAKLRIGCGFFQPELVVKVA